MEGMWKFGVKLLVDYTEASISKASKNFGSSVKTQNIDKINCYELKINNMWVVYILCKIVSKFRFVLFLPES